MRLFDLGAEVDLARLGQLRGRPTAPAPVVAHSPAPTGAAFPQPVEVCFDAADGPAGATVELRVHRLGALSVRLRWPCTVEKAADLPAAAQGARFAGRDVEAAARHLLEEALVDLRPALHDPYQQAVTQERYTVYCLQATPAQVPALLERDGSVLAGLVADTRGETLVPSRRASALRHLLQYTPGDAVIPGWDHAVVVDEPDQYEDILDVMELANLELLEFRTYDAYLDARLENSFASLDRLWSRGGLFRSARSTLQDISRLRVELARLTDNLHDTGKVFGDWYTAQLHRRLQERFHIDSWQKAVAAKMDTLEDMFHLAQEEANHRRSILLEVMIVLLFIVDLILLLRVE